MEEPESLLANSLTPNLRVLGPGERLFPTWMVPDEQCSRLTSGLHKHLCVYLCTHTDTHTLSNIDEVRRREEVSSVPTWCTPCKNV